MSIFHTSHIEISRSALAHNLAFLRQFLQPGVRLSSVIKGNAYGHGIELFAPLAESCGVRHFSVFSGDEAYRVLQARNEQTTILVMGQLDNAQLEWAIEHEIEFFVFELDRLETAAAIAKRMNRTARIHLEVETGMNRTGFSPTLLRRAANLLKSNKEHLEFKGLCTHFAGAESIANYYRIKKQQQVYSRALNKLAGFGLYPQLQHIACSAASIRYPKTQLDMVRIGILQYGFFPSRETLVDYLTKRKEPFDPLRRLISWKSKVMDVKPVKTGEFVGYGTSFMANSDMQIAIVPIGYSHGYSRGLSNQGRVLIHGQRVNVVGTVNMNMLSVDISNLEGVKKGDEVVLIGQQGEQEISVSSFGEYSDQINYELLTRLPADIPRKVIP
ncbi:MAG: alanine racemase [Phaeodactylibacter sp.]|nr:alanine racemase [Phaeodactylibacter sp.]